MSEPVIRMAFSVRDPIGINATYKRGAGKRLYKSAEAMAFHDRLVWSAMLAAKRCGWPQSVWRAKSVRVTAQLFNTRHDADAVTKSVRDAFNGLLYQDDRIVSNGANDPPIQDGGERRVDIIVELLEVHEIFVALKMKQAHDDRKLARYKRQARKSERVK